MADINQYLEEAPASLDQIIGGVKVALALGAPPQALVRSVATTSLGRGDLDVLAALVAVAVVRLAQREAGR